jgi:hypothetical protein
VDTQISAADLQAFYLEAAAATFAAGLEPIELELGLKYFQYERDDLVYLDSYSTNGEYSAGQTTIYTDGSPIWVMQYQGWCKNNDLEVIAFLQRALLAAYTNGVFRLGRGPLVYREEDPYARPMRQSNPLIYANYPDRSITDTTSFEYFSGSEVICRYWQEHLTLFTHQFQGMILRDEDQRKQTWLRNHE